jgi:hypothetical protein
MLCHIYKRLPWLDNKKEWLDNQGYSGGFDDAHECVAAGGGGGGRAEVD